MKISSIYALHDTKKVYHITRWQVFPSLGLFGFCFSVLGCLVLVFFKERKKEKTLLFSTSIPISNVYASVKVPFFKKHNLRV